MAAMQRFEQRLDSFMHPVAQVSLAASQSRRAPKGPTWPHPPSASFNPTTLALAGFYFDPSAEAPDNCTCFLCGKSLGGWEDGDDPATEHVKHDGLNCGWARGVCQVEIEDRIGDHAYADSYHKSYICQPKTDLYSRLNRDYRHLVRSRRLGTKLSLYGGHTTTSPSTPRVLKKSALIMAALIQILIFMSDGQSGFLLHTNCRGQGYGLLRILPCFPERLGTF